MKRTVLDIKLASGKSKPTRRLALPGEWTLRELHAACMTVFPEMIGPDVFVFVDIESGGTCCGTTDRDSTRESEDGLKLNTTLGAAFAEKGTLFLCRSDGGLEEREATLHIESLEADEGTGPECLGARGGGLGTWRPDLAAINTALGKMGKVASGGAAEGGGGEVEGGDVDGDEGGEGMEWDGTIEGAGWPWRRRTELRWVSPGKRTAPEEEAELDDSPVAPELYRRACEWALQVWHRRPWYALAEGQAVAIRMADGRERVLSVLGGLGDYRALAFYPSLAIQRMFSSLAPEQTPFGPNHFHSFWQWQLAFLTGRELLPGEWAAVRKSGVKFERGNLPSFETFAPGFMPARMGGRELGELVQLLEAALELFDNDRAMDEIVGRRQGVGRLHAWERMPWGKWRLSYVKRPTKMRFRLDLPTELLRRIRELPVEEGVGSFGEVILPGAMRGGRQPALRMLLGANEGEGGLIPVGVPADGGAHKVFRPEESLEKLARALLEYPFGYFPSRLASPCDFTALFLRRLAELRGGGARFDGSAECPVLLKGKEELSRFLPL